MYASTSARSSALRTTQHRAVAPSSRAVSLRSRHVARVADVNQDNFAEQVLKSDKTVLVDFWASWCGPCKLVAPLMDWAEKEYGDKLKVVKVEHDANPKLIAQYKVYGLPTLVLFKGGQEIAGSKREGAITKTLLQKYLEGQGV